jgi:hypothetical protein
MRKFLSRAVTALLLASSSIRPSLADEHGHGHGGGHHGDHGHGHADRWHGDIHYFHQYDLGRWRGGRWYHGSHGGRAGWWWIVAGVWYFYPAPVYPYPDPYLPPLVSPPPAPAQAAPQYWYYCPNPAGYYPYVPQCSTDWQLVPATPPSPPPN